MFNYTPQGYKDGAYGLRGVKKIKKSVFSVDKTGLRIYDNGSNVNKLLLSYSPVATGLAVRTETITMTDMNQSGALIAPRYMLGAKQVRRRVKPGPPGENKLSLMGKKLRISTSHQTTFLRSHYIISAVGYRHDGEGAFFL